MKLDELLDINKESGCDGEDEDISHEVITAKNFTVKQLLEIFHDIESTKGKVSEAYLNLRSSMKIHRNIGEVATPY